MDIARKLGTLVVFAVPAVIGGGIAYWLFDGSYNPVIVFEAILLLLAGSLVSN
ncbi:conserved hypothetical protein [Candidatus Magnetomoraceae bacterium gMMP-15]